MKLDLSLIEPIIKTLENLFSEEETERIARQSKFVERSTNRMSGRIFLIMNVLRTEGYIYQSLNDQCSYLKDVFGIIMKKQSLDERYGPEAVVFMKTCFAKVINAMADTGSESVLSNGLQAIYLCDSSSFKLSNNMKDKYPGSGTAAGIKIFYSFELLSGQCKSIDWVAGKRNDTNYLATVEKSIVPNSLYIKDLGFWSTEHFSKIHQSKAYFITRYKSPNHIYSKQDDKMVQLDLQVALKNIEQATIIEDLFLGDDNVPVRLHVEKVSEEIAQKRRTKMLQKAASNKSTSSELTLFLCQYSIFITNAPSDIVPIEHIRVFYMLRWQIELIFKAWKSVFELEKIQRMSTHRFECYLMGKLMAILLSTHLQNLIKDQLWEEEEFEISEWKAHKIFKKNSLH
jgi:hypothetical protein